MDSRCVQMAHVNCVLLAGIVGEDSSRYAWTARCKRMEMVSNVILPLLTRALLERKTAPEVRCDSSDTMHYIVYES